MKIKVIQRELVLGDPSRKVADDARVLS